MIGVFQNQLTNTIFATSRYLDFSEFLRYHRETVCQLVSIPLRRIGLYISVHSKGRKNNDLLQDVSFIDEYRGEKLPEGKKAVTFRLVIGSSEKTLTADEIDKCVNAIFKRLEKLLKAERRN